MAYATWLVGTSALTSAAGFGLTGGWWIKMPDSFPPIQYVQTTSIALPGGGDFRGLAMTLIDTTTGGHVVHQDARGIEEYVKGDRWFRARSDPAISNQGADKLERMFTRIELYYRDQAEGGDIP